MDNLFYKLTPDIVINAVEKNGFATSGHYFVLNSYENRVYDLRLESGDHIIVKFYRPNKWTKEQILEEHEFLGDLKSSEIPVCAPISLLDGTTIGEEHGIYFAIWQRTGGRSPEELTDEELLNLGRSIARIHAIGKSKKTQHRPALTSEKYVLEPLEILIKNEFIPYHLVDRYKKTAQEIANIYDELIKNVPMHRIHGDCHMGNILKNNDAFFFLDFDDFIIGPAVQDIWMFISSRDISGKRQRDLLISGYREFLDFDESWFKLVEPLRAIRYIYYSAWIARRWEDPSFPFIFPHFGTLEYWEKETIDLEEQLALIYEDKDPFTESKNLPKEKELTNKDFFWDLEE